MPRSNTLLLIGLGLNVVGTATIFMFAYPPQDERRHRLFLTLTRMALILMFCAFCCRFWRRGTCADTEPRSMACRFLRPSNVQSVVAANGTTTRERRQLWVCRAAVGRPTNPERPFDRRILLPASTISGQLNES